MEKTQKINVLAFGLSAAIVFDAFNCLENASW